MQVWFALEDVLTAAAPGDNIHEVLQASGRGEAGG